MIYIMIFVIDSGKIVKGVIVVVVGGVCMCVGCVRL